MEASTLVMAELALTAIICLGFGFQQLWSLRREKERVARERAAAQLADQSQKQS